MIPLSLHMGFPEPLSNNSELMYQISLDARRIDSRFIISCNKSEKIANRFGSPQTDELGVLALGFHVL